MLSIFSTIEELRSAPDEEIRSNLFSVEHSIVIKYFLELKSKTNQLEDASINELNVLSTVQDVQRAPKKVIAAELSFALGETVVSAIIEMRQAGKPSVSPNPAVREDQPGHSGEPSRFPVSKLSKS